MKKTPQVGLQGTHRLTVTAKQLVPALYPEFASFLQMPPAFATGFLVGFVEWACIETINPHLDAGERSVGIHINISHETATPADMIVTARVVCIRLEGRRLYWSFEVRDEIDIISRGQHERFVIDLDRFMTTMRQKQDVR